LKSCIKRQVEGKKKRTVLRFHARWDRYPPLVLSKDERETHEYPMEREGRGG